MPLAFRQSNRTLRHPISHENGIEFFLCESFSSEENGSRRPLILSAPIRGKWCDEIHIFQHHRDVQHDRTMQTVREKEREGNNPMYDVERD